MVCICLYMDNINDMQAKIYRTRACRYRVRNWRDKLVIVRKVGKLIAMDGCRGDAGIARSSR